MKPTEAQRKWCKSVIKKWRPRVFLGEWFIDLAYAKEDLEEQQGGRPAAECWADPVYKQATITIYPCFWNSPKDRQEFMLIHELVHCQTQAIWNICVDFSNGKYATPQAIHQEIEKLTQRITNMVYQQEWE